MASPDRDIELLEQADLLDQIHERFQNIGLSDPRLTTATAAVILGGRKVLAIHGASPEMLQVVFKAEAGKTPRTVADLESGRVGKAVIRQQFPNARINEEETGDEEALEGSRDAHHVDPLDGTSSFARELRYSTVADAVYVDGKPYAAAICHPYERELVVAQVGKGAHLFALDENLVLSFVSRRRQLEVSKSSLDGGIAFVDALFNANTSPRKFAFMADLVKLSNNNLGFRMSGSNIDQQLKVAKGSAEITLTDAVGGFFDLAAGGLAIIEAGGKFTDKFGDPVDETTQVALGTNGTIHDDVLDILTRHYFGYDGFNK
ncbi:hypothetical protein A3B39_03300 [Candidatus Daviesbacteria bacterium RIFCSPLOWO2_01_FULL_37_10]|nr:MAG: hypothetical protein A3B39_03300 [Candidatus Daviesbacteria bacterium RIFCSPLOWO2_01_FULL_37_10]